MPWCIVRTVSETTCKQQEVERNTNQHQGRDIAFGGMQMGQSHYQRFARQRPEFVLFVTILFKVAQQQFSRNSKNGESHISTSIVEK